MKNRKATFNSIKELFEHYIDVENGGPGSNTQFAAMCGIKRPRLSDYVYPPKDTDSESVLKRKMPTKSELIRIIKALVKHQADDYDSGRVIVTDFIRVFADTFNIKNASTDKLESFLKRHGRSFGLLDTAFIHQMGLVNEPGFPVDPRPGFLREFIDLFFRFTGYKPNEPRKLKGFQDAIFDLGRSGNNTADFIYGSGLLSRSKFINVTPPIIGLRLPIQWLVVKSENIENLSLHDLSENLDLLQSISPIGVITGESGHMWAYYNLPWSKMEIRPRPVLLSDHVDKRTRTDETFYKAIDRELVTWKNEQDYLVKSDPYREDVFLDMLCAGRIKSVISDFPMVQSIYRALDTRCKEGSAKEISSIKQIGYIQNINSQRNKPAKVDQIARVPFGISYVRDKNLMQEIDNSFNEFYCECQEAILSLFLKYDDILGPYFVDPSLDISLEPIWDRFEKVYMQSFI